MKHRLADGALDAVRSEKDITCWRGPILEAQQNRVAWPLDVTFEAFRWRYGNMMMRASDLGEPHGTLRGEAPSIHLDVKKIDMSMGLVCILC